MYFRKGITWSFSSSGENIGFKILPMDLLFDVSRCSSIFLKENEDSYYVFLAIKFKNYQCLLKFLTLHINFQMR